MTEERDEVDLFIREQRLRFVKRLLVVGLLAVGGYSAWPHLPHSVDQLMGLKEERPGDDPRAIFLASAPPPDQEARLQQDRWLFSRLFPNWIEALRKHRKHLATSPDDTDDTELAAARKALLEAVARDEQLQTPVKLIVSLGEQKLNTSGPQIDQAFAAINAILQDRKLPFLAQSELIQQDSMLTLRARFYERLNEESYQIDQKTWKVALLERLDLADLDRDADVQPAAGGRPTVYLRAVATATNETVFGALSDRGRWPLTRAIAPSPEVKELELSLAKAVAGEWSQFLEKKASPAAREAMIRLSGPLADRNALARDINLRDPGRPIMLEPSSVTLGWNGEAWLANIEPYAVQGKVRLMLEDIEHLRALDQEAGKALREAAPAVQEILREQVRLAAMREVRRVSFLDEARPVPPPLVARLGAEEARARNPLLASRLTGLAEARQTCISQLAGLAGDTLEGTTLMQPVAQVALEKLAAPVLHGRSIGTETVVEAVSSLKGLSCEELNKRAMEAYQDFYGPYSPVTPLGEAVADVDRLSSSRTQ